MRKTDFIFAAVLSLFVVTGPLAVADTGKERFDIGAIENSVYTNPYFKMRMKIPSPWQIQGEAVKKQLEELGKNALAGDDAKMKAAAEAAAKTSHQLLLLMMHPLGAPVDFNPNFIAMSERVAEYPGIKQPGDYLYNVKRVLQSSQAKYSFDGDIKSENNKGRSFAHMSSVTQMGTMKIKQKYLTTLDKGYALSFILTYTTESELKELQKLFNAVEFY